jgi:hypothetical protein
MVLGVHWLEVRGLILWDFSTCTVAFVQDGCHFVWMAVGGPQPQPILKAANGDLIEDLLSHFKVSFAEPKGLPPPWD